MWSNPALWTAIAGCIGAVGALIQATRAHTRASDAHAIAVGHALDRASHPAAPVRGRRVGAVDLPPPAAGPSSPARPS